MKGTYRLLFVFNLCTTFLTLCAVSVLAQPARSRVGVEIRSRDNVKAVEAQAQPKGVELRCRGGQSAFTFEKYGEDRQLPSGESQVVLRLTFIASPLASGITGSGLQPGTNFASLAI